MGSCLSSVSSSSPSTSPPSSFDYVRVVHLSGYVEDFDSPVTVSVVIGKPVRHLVCSSSQLLSVDSAIPRLLPDDTLKPGQIYFMLPFSIFQSDTTTADLVTLVTRLTAVARACKGKRVVTRQANRINELFSRSHNSVGLMFGSPERIWLPGLSPVAERKMERSEGFKNSKGIHFYVTANAEGFKIC